MSDPDFPQTISLPVCAECLLPLIWVLLPELEITSQHITSGDGAWLCPVCGIVYDVELQGLELNPE